MKKFITVATEEDFEKVYYNLKTLGYKNTGGVLWSERSRTWDSFHKINGVITCVIDENDDFGKVAHFQPDTIHLSYGEKISLEEMK